MTRNEQLTREWISSAQTNGICIYGLSDRLLAKEMRRAHVRSGAFGKDCPVKEARGVAILAWGKDELGNIVALCADRKTRQFI